MLCYCYRDMVVVLRWNFIILVCNIDMYAVSVSIMWFIIEYSYFCCVFLTVGESQVSVVVNLMSRSYVLSQLAFITMWVGFVKVVITGNGL